MASIREAIALTSPIHRRGLRDIGDGDESAAIESILTKWIRCPDHIDNHIDISKVGDVHRLITDFGDSMSVSRDLSANLCLLAEEVLRSATELRNAVRSIAGRIGK